MGGNEALLLGGSWRGLGELDNVSAACIMHAPLQSLPILGKAMAIFCKCFRSGCMEADLKGASSIAAFFSWSPFSIVLKRAYLPCPKTSPNQREIFNNAPHRAAKCLHQAAVLVLNIHRKEHIHLCLDVSLKPATVSSH